MSKPNVSKWPRAARTTVAALLATSVLAGGGLLWSLDGAAATPHDAGQQAAPVFAQAGFADLAAKVKPAVVSIMLTEAANPAAAREIPRFPPGMPFGNMLRRYFQQQSSRPLHAVGSGFIISADGYIVTNNHVVDGARKIRVTLNDGSTYPAKVMGRDPETDLALVKIDAGHDLPHLSFGNSGDERVGDWVIAVGNPFGFGNTVTAGIVSAFNRNIGEGPYDDFIQFDAPMNPGNSGGPLINQAGQVIGIDTAIYSLSGGSVGVGFAIPSDIASKVVAELRDNGSVTRGWLGVQLQPITEPLAKAMGRPGTHGALVDQVEDGSPAAKAKLEPGDVITAFNGAPVKTPRDLAMDVASAQIGKAASLTIWRAGQKQTVDVVLVKQNPEEATATPGKGWQSGPAVGMLLTPLTPEMRNELGVDPSTKGVAVAEVAPGSRAAVSGLRAGDVITRIGNTAVSSPAQAAAAIRSSERAHKEALPLLVVRGGTAYYLPLKIARG